MANFYGGNLGMVKEDRVDREPDGLLVFNLTIFYNFVQKGKKKLPMHQKESVKCAELLSFKQDSTFLI